jgi:PleD family two-component response regulator
MEHTPSVEEMIAVVQAYILERKNRKIRIVIDNPMRIRRDIMLLNQAYNIAVMYNNKEK